MKLVKQEPKQLQNINEDLAALIMEQLDFEACIKCKIHTEIDFLDKFGRCPDCAESSLRLAKI